MLKIVQYNRDETLKYAHRWALERNPKFMDFESYGGDCTNFSSQCIYAGCNIMNYTKTYGWYYLNGNNRTPSWTGVNFLYNFLISNKSEGPFAKEVDRKDILVGDIIQLGNKNDNFYHSLVVTMVDESNILICSHTIDSYMRPIDSYIFEKIRYIHILGARK